MTLLREPGVAIAPQHVFVVHAMLGAVDLRWLELERHRYTVQAVCPPNRLFPCLVVVNPALPAAFQAPVPNPLERPYMRNDLVAHVFLFFLAKFYVACFSTICVRIHP